MAMQDANIRETQELIASDKVEGTSVTVPMASISVLWSA
jgi:hypothetical protein